VVRDTVLKHDRPVRGRFRGRLLLSPVALACLFMTCELVAAPHGGQFRGPNQQPPGPSPTPTPTPTPTTPSVPVPTGVPRPTTGGGRAPTPRPGGIPAVTTPDRADLQNWYHWWEFNRDPYVFRAIERAHRPVTPNVDANSEPIGDGASPEPSLKRRRMSGRIRELVMLELKKQLDKRNTDREVVASALIALARLADSDEILPSLSKHLSDQQLRSETAALAMGISGFDGAIDPLLDLALDRKDGQRAVGKKEVPFRTRSFALYGLALLLRKTDNAYAKHRMFQALKPIFDPKARERQDVQVAALHAIRLLTPKKGVGGEMLRADARKFVIGLLRRKRRRLPPLVLAHAATALAGVVGKTNDVEAASILASLLGSRRTNSWVHYSAVIGLGTIGGPDELDVISTLERQMRAGRDHAGQGLAAIALGRIGGPYARKALLSALKDGRVLDIHKPWISLGLAVLTEAKDRTATNPPVDEVAGDAILAAFGKCRNPERAAGFAIALGVMRYAKANAAIRKKLRRTRSRGLAKGYLVEALGLLGDPKSREPVKKVAEASLRRPEILSRAALALTMLSDRTVVPWLMNTLKTARHSMHVQAAVAQALGHIGRDPEAEALVEILQSRKRGDYVKSYAAVALGLLGEISERPWYSYLSVDINYLASMETLVGGSMGVLDLL